MASSFRTTAFGQLVRLVSRGRLFRYPDEVDPSLWKKAIEQDIVSHSTSPGELSGPEKNIASQDVVLQGESGMQNQSVLLVGWYGDDDPEVRMVCLVLCTSSWTQNPQNLPFIWKTAISVQICVLNFAVYIASSIYVPGEPGVMHDFGGSETVATLGLSLFTV